MRLFYKIQKYFMKNLSEIGLIKCIVMVVIVQLYGYLKILIVFVFWFLEKKFLVKNFFVVFVIYQIDVNVYLIKKILKDIWYNYYRIYFLE